MRPRRYSPTGLQLEHEQLSGNGLRSALRAASVERTTKPNPDGRLVRRLQPRRTWDLSTFATKRQISATAYMVGPADSRGFGRTSWTTRTSSDAYVVTETIEAEAIARRLSCSPFRVELPVASSELRSAPAAPPHRRRLRARAAAAHARLAQRARSSRVVT